MKRLAMTAALGVIAFAVPGVAPSSGASRSGASPMHSVRSASAPLIQPTLDLATLHQVEGPPTPSDAGRTVRPARASRGVDDAGVWAALAECESNGNPRAVGGGGRYFGAFQFSLATWHSLGFAGSPLDAGYALQRLAAQRLQARSGWDQWPRCSRHLGLR